MKALEQTVEIPVPPSVNNLYATVSSRKLTLRQGRLVTGTARKRTKTYEDWRERTLNCVKAEIRRVRTYPIAIVVTVYGGQGWNQRRDVANVEKATADILVEAGIIRDDCTLYVHECRQRYIPDASEHARCELTVVEDWASGGEIR